jgi:hypothetical protein
MAPMLTYSQFCPVAKTAEVFGDRWAPIIMRELCFGTRTFGELLDAAPLISRTVLDPKMLVWGLRRQIDPAEVPTPGFVIRFDFRGIPKSNRSPRYWWLVLRPEDIEVCLKAPARNVDVVIAADLATFTKVWLGYCGLAAALASGRISLHGTSRAIATVRRLLALPDEPQLKSFKFSAFSHFGAATAR